MDALDAASDKQNVPSCLGCRQRKLKCSREQPACAHCIRLDVSCEYDIVKNKPGIRIGAVNSLKRRVEALEEAILQRPTHYQHEHDHSPSLNNTDTVAVAAPDLTQILSTLATELQKLNARAIPRSLTPSSSAALYMRESPTTQFQASTHYTAELHSESSPVTERRKRLRISKKRTRRFDSCGNPNIELSMQLEPEPGEPSANLPPADVLEETVNVYFDFIQPWIPMLHETRFRQRTHEPTESHKIRVVLHAIVYAAIRYVSDDVANMTPSELTAQMCRSRKFVVLKAMDDLQLENLQALVIVAFADVGNGDSSRAWPIIGSLTRTVEYLQLTVESDVRGEDSYLRPSRVLAEPNDWTEEEERRRLFWVVFCLDRFCSITTGWSTSLTSDDVRRRLPADGGLWHKGKRVTTPFFGIWDKSFAKIGRSLAFMPNSHAYTSQTLTATSPTQSATGPITGGQNEDDTNMTTTGALAYRIEATESLSRITVYFLQQQIDFTDHEQVSNWLTRFKELDLRLVHWKMFLPRRWRDSNISDQPNKIDMDPNLTLAHLIHNTSMILLHQRIAYPDKCWTFRLPCTFSADACQAAAVETASIAEKYLLNTVDTGPLADQFAFCVFISGRVLLLHRHRTRTMLAPEFDTLIHALETIHRRWIGSSMVYGGLSRSLAGKYAAELRWLQSQCENDSNLEFDVLGYTSIVSQSLRGQDTQTSTVVAVDESRDLHFTGSTADAYDEGLPTFPGLLLEDNFTAMDRIISLDDMIFTVGGYDAN